MSITFMTVNKDSIPKVNCYNSTFAWGLDMLPSKVQFSKSSVMYCTVNCVQNKDYGDQLIPACNFYARLNCHMRVTSIENTSSDVAHAH